MIYALTILVFILVILVIKMRADKAKLTEERDEAQAKVKVLEEEVKILKYNYTSLQKVYKGMLKKHDSLKKVYASTLKKHNLVDVEFKKIQKALKTEKNNRKR